VGFFGAPGPPQKQPHKPSFFPYPVLTLLSYVPSFWGLLQGLKNTRGRVSLTLRVMEQEFGGVIWWSGLGGRGEGGSWRSTVAHDANGCSLLKNWHVVIVNGNNAYLEMIA
jgi:hypothetical protein